MPKFRRTWGARVIKPGDPKINVQEKLSCFVERGFILEGWETCLNLEAPGNYNFLIWGSREVAESPQENWGSIS